VGVVVRAAVARGRDEEDVRGVRARDGVEQRLGEGSSAPAVVGGHDVQTVTVLQVGEVVHRLDRVGQRAAGAAEELAADEGDLVVDTDDPCAVGLGPDGPRNVRAVVVEIPLAPAVGDAVVAVGKVPAVAVGRGG